MEYLFKEVSAFLEVELRLRHICSEIESWGVGREEIHSQSLPCFSDTSLGMFNFEGNSTACFYIHNPKSKTWLTEDKVLKGRQNFYLTSG